jgi:hypothetical protein
MTCEHDDIVRLAETGRWSEVRCLLSPLRDPITSWTLESKALEIRKRIDYGVLYHLLSSNTIADNSRLLEQILSAGADHSRTLVTQRKFCFFKTVQKWDPVDLAVSSGKKDCVRALLKFDKLFNNEAGSPKKLKKKRLKQLRVAQRAGFEDISETLVLFEHHVIVVCSLGLSI